MKVRFSILADASGSMGGVTASRNRAGPYLRARVVPTNPSSAFQVTMRAIFGNLATAWLTLTDVQRKAWETYAENVPTTDRLGNPLTLTGQQMYVRNNSARIQAALSRVDNAPTVFSMDSLSPVAIEAASAAETIEVTFEDTDAWTAETGAALLVYGSNQVAATINFFKGPYRFAGALLGDTTTPITSPQTVASPFALTQSNAQFTRVVSVRSDGRISPEQFIGPGIIVA